MIFDRSGPATGGMVGRRCRGGMAPPVVGGGGQGLRMWSRIRTRTVGGSSGGSPGGVDLVVSISARTTAGRHRCRRSFTRLRSVPRTDGAQPAHPDRSVDGDEQLLPQLVRDGGGSRGRRSRRGSPTRPRRRCLVERSPDHRAQVLGLLGRWRRDHTFRALDGLRASSRPLWVNV